MSAISKTYKHLVKRGNSNMTESETEIERKK
jgi:hypothetical protein